MNYFGIGIARLSILKLSNFPLQLSAPSVGMTVARVACDLSETLAKTGQSSEAGLFHKSESTLEHQNDLIWLLSSLYCQQLLYQPLSHSRGTRRFVQDTVFLSIILKYRGYEVPGFHPTSMTCTMLFKER